MKDFIKLVERMRGAQKSFNNTANRYFFEQMKELEAQVDNYIRNYNINEVIKQNPRHLPCTISIYDWLNTFCRVYGENSVVGFSFYLAALFRDIIVDHFKCFPILNISGPKGTGKSEMAVSISKLFGDLTIGINMRNATLAAMDDYVSHTHNAVCHIDEYNNSVAYDKIQFLKGLWAGYGASRIYNDKNVIVTKVDSGIILTGQEMTTADIALFSRVIFTSFTKTKFTDEEKAIYGQLKDIEKSGLTHITNEVLTHREMFKEKYMDNFNEACKEMADKIDKLMIEDRIWRNWMLVLAAFRTLKDVLTLPFNYEKVLNVMAGMIQRQNDLIININIQNESDQ